MKELELIKSDNKLFEELESLITQVSLAKKLYPTAFALIAKNSWIDLRSTWSSDRKLKQEDLKIFFSAKIQVDKINNSLIQEYGK